MTVAKPPAEHGMLFSQPMVVGLLKEVSAPGAGKTQTRRLIGRRNSTVDSTASTAKLWDALQFASRDTFVDDSTTPIYTFAPRLKVPHRDGETIHRVRSRIEVGDLVWVKETWANAHDNFDCDDPYCRHGIEYRAALTPQDRPGPPDFKWRTSMFMPRRHCRLTLKVTDVRIQRLQAISEDDARAEGVEKLTVDDDGKFYDDTKRGTYRTGYAGLWSHLNGSKPGCDWDANPWVYCYTFSVQPTLPQEIAKDAA